MPENLTAAQAFRGLVVVPQATPAPPAPVIPSPVAPEGAAEGAPEGASVAVRQSLEELTRHLRALTR